MKRKLLCALLCAAMTATMLAGCGDKKDDNAADTNQEASNGSSASDESASSDNNAADESKEAGDSESSSSEGGNKLTVWCWDPAFNMYAMEEAGKIYKKDHADFELEVIETP